MTAFAELLVWRDPEDRSGPECMAVDELLLMNLRGTPVLRLYDWQGDWVSVGYFGDLEATEKMFGNGVSIVRRWTGGGVVDHRNDVTYSLMIPRDHPVAKLRGAESYQLLHRAVAEALYDLGSEANLVEVDGSGDSDQCFEKPVAWDVVDTTGRKLAGAGQRRTRWGLLHQGSVQVEKGEEFGELLKSSLSEKVKLWEPPPGLLEKAVLLAEEKYQRSFE